MPRPAESLQPAEGVGSSCNSQEAKGCRFPKMGLQYPNALAWTVAFDGKMIAELRSAPPPIYTLRTQLGTQVLSKDSKPPRIGQNAGEFDACSHYRPLVLVSQPNYRDPDLWKPFHPEDPALLKQARAAYRTLRQGKPQSGCRCPEESIVVQPKGYRSAKGDILLSIAIATQNGKMACECDGADWDIVPDWFLLKNGHFLQVGRHGLALIDAGDYDGDGASEILFTTIEDHDAEAAYVLFCPRDGSVHEFFLPNENSY
jgi:hypothetical protein